MIKRKIATADRCVVMIGARRRCPNPANSKKHGLCRGHHKRWIRSRDVQAEVPLKKVRTIPSYRKAAAVA